MLSSVAMLRFLLTFLALLLAPQLVAEETSAPKIEAEISAKKGLVVVIPVQGVIADPVLYIIRRGLKEAIDAKADLVVLDMDTPGGSAGTTIEIMEAINKFPGRTATFVNEEAGSAGAIIASITDDIYFAPAGVMGAAELVSGGGQDVPEAMKRKMESYIRAKTRAMSSGPDLRADVLKAMMNSDFELKIGEEILKEKGELLTLSAKEAIQQYGDPPETLLASGIVENVDELLGKIYGERTYTVQKLEVTWSEDLAVVLNGLAPILMGLGLLGLFIEFKTPGFGIFGVGGGLLLGIVFLSHYVAGFSGHEPMLIFVLGVLLVAVELFFLPGMVVFALSGIVMMLGSLLWAMADIWPNEPITISGDLFFTPMLNLSLGLVVAVVGAVLIMRFLPKGLFWDKMILQTAIAPNAPAARTEEVLASSLIGQRGIASTDLFPSGQVEIDGQRYEAKVAVGSIDEGQEIVVVEKEDFDLLVRPVNEEDKA